MLGGVALACVATHAGAAASRLRVAIPPRTYADALIDLGLQANITILGTSTCGAGGRVRLSGDYTLQEALDRLLADAPCRYRIVDARTVRIFAAPPATPAPPPPPNDPARPPALVAELVVTATKRPMTLDRLPAGVSAVSRDQVESTRAVDIGQTTGQLAGVLTTNLGPGRDKLLMRGLSDGAFTGRTRSTVGSYLDNAPINSNAPDPDLRLVDIESIEVVRGPQGALYGSGAVAGVYRIVTAKPDDQRVATGFSAATATTEGGDPSREIDGYLNLPLIRDRAALRLVAYKDIQGGYLDNADLRISNVDKTTRDGGRVALALRIDDNWKVQGLAATQHLRTNDTQYVTPKRPGATTGGRANRVREAHNNDFSYAGLSIDGDLGWASLTSSASYVHHVYSSQFDASAALGVFEAKREDLGVYTEATRANMLVQDLVLRSANGAPFEWLAGVFLSRSVQKSPSTLGILSTGSRVSTVYMENRKDRFGEYAVYGEGSLHFGDGWSATVGGRAFESRVHTTAQLDVAQPFGPRFFDQARTFNGFSPKLSLQREFRNGDLAYILLTEGYRPGGFNSSGLFPIRASRTTFKPDRLRNYETGVKLRRLDGRLAVRAAAYYDEWSDIQTDQYRASGLAYTANVADARILGLEGEVSYDWPIGLSLQLNGLLADSTIRNPNFDFAPQLINNLPGVPRASGGVLAVYERPLGSVNLRLVGEASYVGRSSLSFDAARSTRMGHYLRAKLSAQVATDAWSVAAYVTNPFDDRSDTFAYGNPFSFGEVRQVTPQRPRTFGVRVAAAF